MKLSSLILGLLIGASAFANVFGKDDRVVVRRFSAHLMVIGSIGDCTAVLVAKDIALTAAHCILDENENEKPASSIVFSAGYTRGKSFGASRVKDIFREKISPFKKISADWALLVLEQPIGLRLGWMEISRTDAVTQLSEIKTSFSLAGYSGDFSKGTVMTQHQNCRIRGKDSYMFLHDCDFISGVSGGGASGAPLFTLIRDSKTGRMKPTIFALNLGGARPGPDDSFQFDDYSDYYANGAIPMHEIADKLAELTSPKMPLPFENLPTKSLASGR